MFLTLLKPAKDNMREKEENTERPGQVQCKVIFVIVNGSTCVIYHSLDFREHKWTLFASCQGFFFYLHVSYDIVAISVLFMM